MSSSAAPDSPTAPHWRHSALVIIDLQRDFSLPDGSAFIAGTDAVVPAIAALRTAFLAAGRPVLHAMRLYAGDGSNAERSRADLVRERPIVRPGHPGAALVDLGQAINLVDRSTELLAGGWIAFGANEWAFYKPRWSAFYGTALDERLRGLGVDTVVVAGCNFPNCPSATLFDATERDYRVVVASDAVSGMSDAGAKWCGGIGVAVLPVSRITAGLTPS